MADEERKKEEHKNSAKPHGSLVEKSLDPQSYDTWVFENYTKERLRALGIIQ